jgi:hypothetical protein
LLFEARKILRSLKQMTSQRTNAIRLLEAETWGYPTLTQAITGEGSPGSEKVSWRTLTA